MTLTGTGRFLTRMALFLAGVVALAVLMADVLVNAFQHNPGLNGVILFALLVGILFIFRQVLMLRPEIAWLESYQRNQNPPSGTVRLLAPMATMLRDRKARLSLSPSAARTLLDSIGARLDEGRDIGRYLIGLLILLGLLGTFWGLIRTVESVGDVVGQLSFGGGDPVSAFEGLKRGLSTPLSAMGTAFSSSLFGLAGSLILGFLDLQSGAAQNRFYNELEEWLAGVTRVGSGPGGDGEQGVPAYIQALLEQTADSLETLQRTLAKGEDSRISANQALLTLSDRLGQFTDQSESQRHLLVQMVEGQRALRGTLEEMVHRSSGEAAGLDAASKAHLRNLDTNIARLAEDMRQGRAETIQELRAEIRLLARTIAALAEQEDR
jgi:biopolymer transport protein ExbB/TolQ